MPQDSQGRYVPDNETLATGSGSLASATKTSSDVSAAFSTAGYDSITATLTVTDRDGTSPTLDVILETSGDGGSTFEVVDQFTQVTGGVPAIAHATTTAGTTGVNEVQTVTISNADGGTFTLTYSGQTTAAIAYGASAAAVTTALEALSNIGVGDVDVVKASDEYTITFQGALAETNVAQLTSNGTSLTATDLTAETMVFGPLGTSSRWAWTIGGSGSPTFTFAIAATADRDA